MKLSLILITISICRLLPGQDTTVFAPLGSTFYYSNWTSQPHVELLKFVVEEEVILNGISARAIKFYAEENNMLVAKEELTKYVYTDGNKVYYWVEDDFYLLYDFGAQAGDTIFSRIEDFPYSLSCFANFENGPFNFSYQIDSIGTIEINGEILRTQFVTPIYHTNQINWIIQSPVIERIGQITWTSYWWGTGEGCFLGGSPGILRCYTDEDIFFKNEIVEFNGECDQISAIETVFIDRPLLYPNPTSGFILLPENSTLTNIYSIQGQKIFAVTNNLQVDVSRLSNNIYIIQYQVDGTVYTSRFIKN